MAYSLDARPTMRARCDTMLSVCPTKGAHAFIEQTFEGAELRQRCQIHRHGETNPPHFLLTQQPARRPAETSMPLHRRHSLGWRSRVAPEAETDTRLRVRGALCGTSIQLYPSGHLNNSPSTDRGQKYLCLQSITAHRYLVGPPMYV